MAEVDEIGNMTLFAGPLNIGASNNPYSCKKAAYKQSSILLTQDLVHLPNFRFREVDKRSVQLADLAVNRWPKPTGEQAAEKLKDPSL